MNNRIWILGTAVISIAVVALGFLLGISPKLSEITANTTQLVTLQAQNAAYQAELASLKQQYENIDDVRAELEKLRESLPADADYEGFINQLDATATTAGATIESFKQNAPIVFGATTTSDTGTSDAPISGGTLLALPFELVVSSTDPLAVFAFIEIMRTGERLFIMGDFTLDISAAATRLTFTGYYYTLVDPNAVPDDAVQGDDDAPPSDPVPTPTETAITPDPASTDPASTSTPVPSGSATPTP